MTDIDKEVVNLLTARLGRAQDESDDGQRLNPRFDYCGNDNVPCIWWCRDMGGYCARCGSARIDLHKGVWMQVDESKLFGKDMHGVPWTKKEKELLGIPLVKEEWWHQAAGWVG